MLRLWSHADHAIKFHPRFVGEHALDERLGISGEPDVVGERVDGETLVVVGEEDSHQFGGAAIASEPRANAAERHLAAKLGHDKSDAAIALMHRVFVCDIPDVLSKILQVAKLGPRDIPGIDLDDIVQQGNPVIGYV